MQPHVAGAENVRAALLFVDRKETPLGIVYATDAASDPKVKIVGVFPEDTHPPIIYPAALTAASKNPDAAKFLQFLESPAARPAFEQQGFTVLRSRQISGARPAGASSRPLNGANRFTATSSAGVRVTWSTEWGYAIAEWPGL